MQKKSRAHHANHYIGPLVFFPFHSGLSPSHTHVSSGNSLLMHSSTPKSATAEIREKMDEKTHMISTHKHTQTTKYSKGLQCKPAEERWGMHFHAQVPQNQPRLICGRKLMKIQQNPLPHPQYPNGSHSEPAGER